MATQRFKVIQVGNQTFELPLQGKNPSWAEELSAIIEALADASQLIQGPNDILLTSVNVLNNQSTPVNFGNINFNTSSVLAIEGDYFIYREFDAGSTVATESGKIYANYDGTSWKLSQEAVGDVGVSFTISNAGVVQYTSTDLAGHVASTARVRFKSIDEAN